MTSGWREMTVGEVVELKRGHDLPSHERRAGDVPVVSSSGISGTHDVAKAPAPGVVTGRYGSIGQVFYVENDFWPLNTTLYVKDFKGNDPLFISYLLRTLDFASCSDKAAVPGVNRNHLHMMRVRVPSVADQRAIARILGALDDKIELNRRMNETLEVMARAIFKSWFVDFDPVRAKAEGRQPTGMDAETAALFPDALEDSSLGKIPAGWTIRQIEDVAERVGMGPFGSSIKVETFVPEGVPIISGQHLRGFMMEDNTFNFISCDHAERLKSANVERGDVIFTHAGSIGQAAYIPDNSRFERYVISQRQFFMRCDRSQVSPSFVALYFGSPKGQHELLANTSSSGVPSIARPVTHLRTIRLAIPPKPVMDAFDALVQPVLLRFRANLEQASTLGLLRDALLPRLLAGELRFMDSKQSREAQDQRVTREEV